MNRNNAPSSFDLVFIVIAPLSAILRTVRLTQSDGDLAAHIRMGETILANGSIPTHSLVSFTAATDPLIAHAWLSEIIFALLFRLGGLPLLSVVTGIVIAGTHASVALFLRKRGVDPRWAVAAALGSLAISSTHWLTRPHMFSIVGTLLTLYLLASKTSRREFLFIPLFALWANLHGGWVYGLMLIAAYAAGDMGEALAQRAERAAWLATARRDVLALSLAVAATVLNPYGLALHREVLSAVTNSTLAGHMAEFLAPNFQEAAPLPFLVATLATVALLALSRRRIPLPWLCVVIISLYLALQSFRNIALFGVSAWPLIALHAGLSVPAPKRSVPVFREFARLDPGSRTGILALPVALALLLLGLNRGWVGDTVVIPDRFNAKAFPVDAIAKARLAGLPGRIFEEWGWGGYIMYVWPEARLHVDPLKFNIQTMRSYSLIEDMRPGWRGELDRWQVRTIIVKARSPLAAGLADEAGWRLLYRDKTAAVFRRAADSSARASRW